MFAMVIIIGITIVTVIAIMIYGVRHSDYQVSVDSASVVAMVAAADAAEKRERDMQATAKMTKAKGSDSGGDNAEEDEEKKARREAALARKAGRAKPAEG